MKTGNAHLTGRQVGRSGLTPPVLCGSRHEQGQEEDDPDQAEPEDSLQVVGCRVGVKEPAHRVTETDEQFTDGIRDIRHGAPVPRLIRRRQEASDGGERNQTFAKDRGMEPEGARGWTLTIGSGWWRHAC